MRQPVGLAPASIFRMAANERRRGMRGRMLRAPGGVTRGRGRSYMPGRPGGLRDDGQNPSPSQVFQMPSTACFWLILAPTALYGEAR